MLVSYQLKEHLFVKGMASLHPDYIESPLWTQTLIEFSVMGMSRRERERERNSMSSPKTKTQMVIIAITTGSRI